MTKLKDAVAYSLSDTDIKNYLNNKTKIIKYSDLNKYNNIDDLIAPYNHAFILYLTAPSYGHWTLLFKRGDNKIEFFDSYGYKPDTEFKFIDNDFRAASNQIYTKVVSLLFDSPYKIFYNHHKLQGKSTAKRQISTCGRWCIGRWLNHHIDENKFKKMMTHKGIDKDDLITLYIN